MSSLFDAYRPPSESEDGGSDVFVQPPRSERSKTSRSPFGWYKSSILSIIHIFAYYYVTVEAWSTCTVSLRFRLHLFRARTGEVRGGVNICFLFLLGLNIIMVFIFISERSASFRPVIGHKCKYFVFRGFGTSSSQLVWWVSLTRSCSFTPRWCTVDSSTNQFIVANTRGERVDASDSIETFFFQGK